MKIKNIFHPDLTESLEIHQDYRGLICDVFYGENIDHVAFISSNPNKLRGNHYHKETTQHILILNGSLEYWYKDFFSQDEPKMYLAKKGDLITTPPFEIHALKITEEGNEFIVFSQGVRGGKDYESDTYRVEPII